MSLNRLSSSLRSRTAKESLTLVKQITKDHGITRVTDVTWMDRIGIPVFVSIRPNAFKHSLCVNAGKGAKPEEAEIGAYMEAVEFDMAAPSPDVTLPTKSPLEIVKSFQDQINFYDFCASSIRTIATEDRVAVVEGIEILSGLGPVLVPAELVYHPLPNNPGASLYGTSTNGLASGNTLDEATAHGIAEVMERHVKSFENVKKNSYLVDVSNSTSAIKQLLTKIENAGLECRVRYRENEFGMAYVTAFVMEPNIEQPLPITSGNGFHPIKEIATIRAISEAVQSRLTHIHGGRDDIMDRVDHIKNVGREQELNEVRDYQESIRDSSKSIQYADIPDFEASITSIQDALSLMTNALVNAGMPHIVRVTLSPPEYPFQVVKIIIPKAENFENVCRRIGPLLLNYMTSLLP